MKLYYPVLVLVCCNMHIISTPPTSLSGAWKWLSLFDSSVLTSNGILAVYVGDIYIKKHNIISHKPGKYLLQYKYLGN